MIKVLYFEDEEAIKIGREYLKMQIGHDTDEEPTDKLLDEHIEKKNLDPKYDFLLGVYLLEFYNGIKSVDPANRASTSKNVINRIMLLGDKKFLIKSTKVIFDRYASKSNDPEMRKKYTDWLYNSKDYKKFIKYAIESGIIVNTMCITHLVLVKQLCDCCMGDDTIDKKVLESIRSNAVNSLNNSEKGIGVLYSN